MFRDRFYLQTGNRCVCGDVAAKFKVRKAVIFTEDTAPQLELPRPGRQAARLSFGFLVGIGGIATGALLRTASCGRAHALIFSSVLILHFTVSGQRGSLVVVVPWPSLGPAWPAVERESVERQAKRVIKKGEWFSLSDSDAEAARAEDRP